MSIKIKIAIVIAIFFWASAFVAIRAGLQDYSPEGLALFRYLIASLYMSFIYFRLPKRTKIKSSDVLALLGIGALGVGVYSIALNYSEVSISSGMASFIISQSPLVSAIFAILFLQENFTLLSILGFMLGVLGVALITWGEKGGFAWDISLFYILVATITSAAYSIMQKPFLKKCHAIEATTLIMWGGTLFLLFYFPQMLHDVTHASVKSTFIVIYLGIFPAAIAYLAWSYVLNEISASHAVSFLYFMPFLATLLGWFYLNEKPALTSILGGVISLAGVWLVNQSYYQSTKNLCR